MGKRGQRHSSNWIEGIFAIIIGAMSTAGMVLLALLFVIVNKRPGR